MSAALLLTLAATSAAQDGYEDVRRLFETGKYYEALEAASNGAAEEPDWEPWQALRIRAQLAVGSIDRARTVLEAQLPEFRWGIDLRLLGHRVYLESGDPERAAEMLDQIVRLGDRSRWRFRNPESQVTLGRAWLLRGADAKTVMDAYFTPAKDEDPELLAPRRAIAELALEKHDYALAADELEAALALEPASADLFLLKAQALAPADGMGAMAALTRALELNPNHVEALLFLVDQRVGAELHDDALEVLDRIHAIHAGEWRAWAYRAVLAHLDADEELERTCREYALARWSTNPGVDHLIGRELSEKYRFAEGAEYQRRALAFDPEHVPARFQLAQDLLRLGDDEEGWRLAEEAADADPYDVVAYNLTVLHDVLAGYTTLHQGRRILRMEPREAAVYGERVLDLMDLALDELPRRYGVSLDDPVTLELFAEQKDFAIRTFGLPGGEGYLGVCFGDVVTMRSAASQGEAPANWEATLWHELCHVVTLKKTRNRMPRWLSEGISVYEEKRRDPAWGQEMRAPYRDRILAGEATPVSQLSSAFLNPDGPNGIAFAYYESSVVVEYIVDEYGFDVLLAVLDDLGQGVTANASLAKRVAPLDELDAAFAAHLKELAEAVPPLPGMAPMHQDGAHALDTLRKRLEYVTERGDWEGLLETADDVLAFQPMSMPAYRAALRAAAELDRPADVLRAGRAVLALDPVDPASVHFRVAEASAALGDEPTAKRHVLQALEAAPRFREAHALLLELTEEDS